MHVILVSSRSARSRSFSISRAQMALAACAGFSSALVVAMVLNYLSLRYAVANDHPPMRPLVAALKAEESQRVQAYVRDGLRTMATKMGELQARLARLDALGSRLSRSAGLKGEEFAFDSPVPGRGGADAAASARDWSLRQIGEELDRLTGHLEDRSDKLRFLESTIVEQSAQALITPAHSPIRGVSYFSSSYGWRVDPFTGLNTFHEGMDFAANTGEPILAAGGGAVVYADRHPQYGNMIEIDHGNDLVTRYAHASRLIAKVGDVVLQGSKIAEVGNTGRSTGPHLHFEVRHRGTAQNPARFLRPPG
ncbi:MAG: M23 family metallopeptidase [Burkholderiales bacterium]|nr:M23 family metallopeptidase [Burkholderiales bacterium]